MKFKLVKAGNDIFSDNKNQNHIIKGLNEAQLKGVTTIEGPVLIVAGAGSGKTKVLTHRIAYIISNGIKGRNILALTFTNKAANEMVSRIKRIVNSSESDDVWAGTFHSIFARILRREADYLGYTSSFSIYDQDDSQSFIKRIMENKGIAGQSSMTANQIKSKISFLKNNMISPIEFLKKAQSSQDNIIGNVYEHYEIELKKNNAMDFDDLLLNIIKLFKENSEVLEKYQNLFKYILVDEYQDTNKAQYLATNMLAKKHKNLCVVGDDAQSIYKWRGADIRNILDFQKDYPDAEIIRLEQNYRSTKTIISAADSVIRKNKFQIPKTLWTENPDGEKILIYNAQDEKEEAKFIANEIKRIINEKNFSNKDFAVLYRTNAQSLAFENAFRASNISYIVVGGMSFYRRKEVKDVLAYLRLLVNQQDTEALNRVINEPPRGIGNTSLKHINDYSNFYNLTFYDALKNADKNDNLLPKVKNSVNRFISLIEKYKEELNSLDLVDLVKNYINETGLIKMYLDIDSEESRQKILNIEQVINDISDFNEANPDLGLDEYLQQITLITDLDEKDTSQNQAKLMTLHSAKGLEFPVVFISGLEESLFPLSSMNYPEDTEEERRLFYVGITRAMELLYLTYSERRMKFGVTNYQKPSKFIKDIDSKFIKSFNQNFNDNYSINQSAQKPLNTTKSYTTKNTFDDLNYKDDYSQIPKGNLNFKVGERVQHKMFGIGRIELIQGEGLNKQVIVNFHNIGRKKLMLNYAKLEKI